MNRNRARALVVLAAILFALPFAGGQVSHAQETQTRQSQEIQNFPQTGQVVAGKVLDYWRAHGGVAQQGYPISDEFTETSASDGKPYAVQYFERAVLERHPENQPPYDVEGALLGDFAYAQQYSDDAPGQMPSTDNPVKFNETGKTLGGKFRTYWQDHGGVTTLGYPISDEFQENTRASGDTRTVQYFERAKLEDHPENAAPNDVQAATLGAQQYEAKYSATPHQVATKVPKAPVAGCSSYLTPGTWKGPVIWNGIAKGSGVNGTGSFSSTMVLDIACDGTFKGTATADKFTAEAKVGPVRVASCTAGKTPIINLVGKEVAMADGLHLAVTDPGWKQGTLECKGPAIKNPTEDLTTKAMTPFDMPVENISEGKIGGSTDFLDKPLEDLINDSLAASQPGAKIAITSTGAWELVLQKK